MNPKISVVLTAHPGYDKYLERAIKSVFDQTFKEWELVIAYDDELTPEAKAVLAKFPETIKVLPAKKFGQHTQPKNRGTVAAVGEYINYLDADNAFRKDHLRALYREALKTGVDVVYGDRMVINEQDPTKKVAGVASDFSLGLLGQQNYIDTSDALVKREAILAVGGWDESLEYFADWNLWVRMAKAGYKFHHLPLTITDYYWHGENNVLKSHDAAKEGKAINFDVQACKIWPDKTIMGERPKLKVAIYTMMYDRLACTQETFTSMREMTKYPFDHFVLDQGSKDKTWTWLMDNEKKLKLKASHVDQNMGISAGSNFLLRQIKEAGEYDVIIKLDNDCGFITNDWLEEIVDIFERNRMAIVSPYVEGLIDHPGGAQRIRNGYISTHYIGLVDHLGGLCCAAPARAYEGFKWEEKDFLHGMQDSIFSQEMRKRGYMLMYLENCRVEHLFNTSFSEKGAELEKEDEKEYRERRKQEKITKYDPEK